MIHRLAYRRRNHNDLHVSGYNERANINTPFELAIRNQIHRFSNAIAAIDRVPGSEFWALTPKTSSGTSR